MDEARTIKRMAKNVFAKVEARLGLLIQAQDIRKM